MRHLILIGAVTALAATSFAQRHGPGRRAHPQAISDTSYASRLQATVSGTPGYTGAPTGGGRAPRFMPVYGGAYFYQAAPPVVVFAPPLPQPPPAPQVIVNQFYTPETAKPLVREYDDYGEEISGVRVYSAPTLSPAPAEPGVAKRAAKPAVYLVAFKDSSIQSAMACWKEGPTLHYVTVQGDHKTTTVSNLDEELTGQLNRERGLEFKLLGK
ncbi:MAG: hypothetical protein M1541_15120 [Acidobacteria bacterium]|nr:hypothetical protein [Acidobacteriota bacterium]